MQELLGEKVVRYGCFDGDRLIGVVLGVTVTARRGKFLFCPHGPIVVNNDSKIIELLILALKNFAHENGSAFLRISPLELQINTNIELYKKLGMRPAPMHMHAETMWVLDIKPSEEVLMQGMRKTTRNLVRRAERDGVKIRISRDINDLDLFEQVYKETADREKFVGFSKKYLEAEFSALNKDNHVFLAFAEYQGDIISTALITVYGNTGFYHQGASTRKHAKVPGAYLLQWEIIRELKRLGIQRYNFWGISDDPKHPWAGLSLFKQGFGGYREDYLHAQDLPLKPSYWLTYIIEQIRRKKRGY
jgi:lipid II:glycine glycyltransferase (peptidoglycan interpeptide bridge formation enzyme)